MKAKLQEQKEAIRLRKEGWYLPRIAEHLGVSKASVHLWAGHIKVASPDRLAECRLKAVSAAQKYHRDKRIAARREGVVKAKEGSLLHSWGCMLYWAEGKKTASSLAFVNMDIDMIKLFFRFLVDELGVERERLSISIRFHGKEYRSENLDGDQVKDFWTKALGVSRQKVKVYKITDQRRLSREIPKGAARNSHPHGICELTVHDVTKIQHIYGALEHYAGIILRPQDIMIPSAAP